MSERSWCQPHGQILQFKRPGPHSHCGVDMDPNDQSAVNPSKRVSNYARHMSMSNCGRKFLTEKRDSETKNLNQIHCLILSFLWVFFGWGMQQQPRRWWRLNPTIPLIPRLGLLKACHIPYGVSWYHTPQVVCLICVKEHVAFALTFLHISSGVLKTQKLNILVCNMLPQVLTRVSRISFWPCLCHCDLGMGRQRVGHTPRCVPHYSQTWKIWRCDHQTRSFAKIKIPTIKILIFLSMIQRVSCVVLDIFTSATTTDNCVFCNFIFQNWKFSSKNMFSEIWDVSKIRYFARSAIISMPKNPSDFINASIITKLTACLSRHNGLQKNMKVPRYCFISNLWLIRNFGANLDAFVQFWHHFCIVLVNASSPSHCAFSQRFSSRGRPSPTWALLTCSGTSMTELGPLEVSCDAVWMTFEHIHTG